MRSEFIETIKNIDIKKWVTSDESSINLAYSRNYGRALQNKRIREGRKDVRFQRKSILSTMRISGEMCPIIFSGTLNKELFSEYLKTQLRSRLAPGDILLLDRSSVHTSKLVMKTLHECGIKHLFLPPYYPDFNPIELLWSYMKSVIRKLKARTHEKLEAAINVALDSVSPAYIQNWFSHCGYSV